MQNKKWFSFIREKPNYQILLFIVFSLSLSFSHEAYAVPAAPIIHTLIQSDGSTFEARQWGDEDLHGWETADGYSIVLDEDLVSWTYAIYDDTGNLVSSKRAVNRDSLPDNLMKHLRPAFQVQEMIPTKRLSNELQTSFLRNVASPSGTNYLPVILINFNDTATTYSKTDFNTLLFGTDTNSMKDYYEETSYGAFSVSTGPGGVVGWYTASNNHDYYGTNVSGHDQWPGDLVYEAVQAADDVGFNFAPYDQNGDGYVDLVTIIHQGDGEEWSRAGIPTDLWSQRSNLNRDNDWGRSHYREYTTDDNGDSGNPVKVNDYIILPEILNDGGIHISTIGSFVHEYGHFLCLPDLYDYDYSSYGIGTWSLMAYGSWNKLIIFGDSPAHMDAWCKYRLGWVNPIVVSGT
jgi:M6 family metalloprotease-like protein